MVERETGIEPALVAWKATVLPLNYSRTGRPCLVAPPAGKAVGYRETGGTGGGRWMAAALRAFALRAAPSARSARLRLAVEPAVALIHLRPAPCYYPTPDTATILWNWWREVDSNHRRRKPADLQSAPVGRLGIPPIVFPGEPGGPSKEPAILTAASGAVNGHRREISPRGSDVEAEVEDVALLHPVLLALQPQPAGVAGAGFAAVPDEVVVADGLGADEALLEVGVDHR